MTLHTFNKNEETRFYFFKNLMENIIKENVEKVALIPHTHVLQPTFEDDGID